MILQKVHLLPSHASCNLLDESLVFMPQQQDRQKIGDFEKDFKNSSNDDTYHKLPFEMWQSLLRFALNVAPAF